MTHTISHYLYTIELWLDGNLNVEPNFVYISTHLDGIESLLSYDITEEWTIDESVICLSMTEVYCCGYEVPIDKAAWSDKNDLTNIYNFIKEQEIRDTWIETHLKGVEND